MHPARDGPVRVRFGVFELDLRTGELRKRGLRIRLQEQPFQVLAMLLEQPRELVTREDLRQRLWTADTFVDFDHGLNKAINKIRGALGDSAASPRFIETVARRGYRFIADVTSVETVPLATSPLATSPPATPDLLPPARRPLVVAEQTARHTRVHGRLAWTIAGVALALVSAVGWIMLARGSGSTTVRSLAVLPLDSLSSDPSQEYFADGMTDQLITTLGQISALRVISRTSVMPYKHTRKLLPQIAHELNVDAVVEGTVIRSGAQVRITAQLIDAAADKHLWAQSYDGDLRDTLALQNTVARAIAEQIRINVTPQEQVALKHANVVNPEAYEAYLKGRYFWNKRTGEGLKRAKGYFDQAVATDPSYAQAYSGLADTYALLGDWQYAVMTAREALPKGKAAAVRALELDHTLGEAHTSLAFILDGFDWDWASADREFRQGIELNPGYATAHHWYAWHLSLLGRHRDAIAEMRKAESLDPLSLIIKSDLAELLLIAHFYDASIQQSRRTIDMDVTFSMAHNQLGQAYLQQQQYEEAIAELQKAIQWSDGNPTSMANLARAYAASGRRNDAVQLLNELKRRSSPSYSNAPEIAVIYAALGDRDQAMTWLEQGYVERFNPGVLLRPGFDPLRSDPRFQALARRVGLNK
jgi:TolB-like protein/DNA-binding winged helix-turn-helix (wHTH) protein/Tfp pilus assembly protein PilF